MKLYIDGCKKRDELVLRSAQNTKFGTSFYGGGYSPILNYYRSACLRIELTKYFQKASNYCDSNSQSISVSLLCFSQQNNLQRLWLWIFHPSLIIIAAVCQFAFDSDFSSFGHVFFNDFGRFPKPLQPMFFLLYLRFLCNTLHLW
jgi:hypothetical protein